MPRLGAQESLLASQQVSVGSGTLKPNDGREIRREWIRIAESGRRRQAVRQAPTPENLAMAGIGVRVIEKKADGD